MSPLAPTPSAIVTASLGARVEDDKEGDPFEVIFHTLPESIIFPSAAIQKLPAPEVAEEGQEMYCYYY